jgi:hypothetical protein
MINENDLLFWTCNQCWWDNWRFRPDSVAVRRLDDAIQALEPIREEIAGIDLIIGVIQVQRAKMFSSACRHCQRQVDIKERTATQEDLRAVVRAMGMGDK